jgi:flavin-binding protein dodecin
VLHLFAKEFRSAFIGSKMLRGASLTQGGYGTMPGTYKFTELVGTSPVSFAEAVKAAVAEAAKTVRHMDWFEVVSERGRIVEGKVQEFQVVLKIGFKLERTP